MNVKYPHEAEFHPFFRKLAIKASAYDKKITRDDLSEDQAKALEDVYDLL